MDWYQPINIYCERQIIGFWAEPVNALTNLAFIFSGLFMAFKTQTDKFSFFLSIQIILIGIASFIFHTFANPIGGLLDTASIFFFGTTYVYCANRRFLHLNWLTSIFIAMLLAPFSLIISFFTILLVGELNGSAWYSSFLILFLTYSFILRNRMLDVSRAFFYCACFFAVSIFFRSIDEAVCNSFSLGTHFMWHILNGFLLGVLVWVMYLSRKFQIDT